MNDDPTVNILLVDDQPAKLLTYEAVLADLGQNLLKASSAREALDTLLRRDIAVILIDVCMPELDGFELVGMIRQHPRFDQTAIILVSAVFLSDVDQLRGYERGAIDYVSVPIIPELLRAKVAAFADLHRKTRQLERMNEELERRVAERTLALEQSTSQLRAGQERLRLAVEGAGMATWDADLRSGIVVASPTFFTILGRDPSPDGEATLDAWRECIHPGDRARVETAMEHARAANSLFSPDHRILRKNDGEIGWLSIFGRFLYDESGSAIRFVGVFFDITARKLNERRVATEHSLTRVMAATRSPRSAAPALLRAICSNLDAVAAVLWLPDETGESMHCACIEYSEDDRLLSCFARASRRDPLTEESRDSGRTTKEIGPVIVRDLQSLRDSKTRDAVVAAGLSAGVAFPLVSEEHCVGIIEYYTREPLEHGTLLPDMLSSLGGLIGRFLTRLELEAELGASQQRLGLAVAAGNVGTWVLDAAKNRMFGDERFAFFFDVNPQEAARGLPLETYLAAVHEEDRERVRASISEHLGIAGEFAIECRVRAADGDIHWIRGCGRVEYDSAGTPIRLPGAIVDLTDPMRMQLALRDADRRKDEFLAILSHELRNPLAPIRNALHLLRLGANDPQTIDLAESIMERQIRQLVRLVDDLLDVSRITRNKLELRREQVELLAVVQDAIEMKRIAIDAAGQELDVLLPDHPIRLDGDPIRLAQVFSNLIDNSSKYTERGGRISITAELDGSTAVIRVRDSGIGIPTDMLSRIFDIFTQARHDPARAQSGLGIGLTIVRRLVEMHDGSIDAYSEGVGHGSEFVVRLPVLVDAVRMPAAPSIGDDSTRKREPGIRIVVADDNVDSATSLSLLLRMMGHETHTAFDGVAAVELVEAVAPEVVLLDIGMPLLDGYGAARRIRALPGGNEMTLVAITGWGQREDRQLAKDAGFDHHLVKPVDVAELSRLLALVTGRGVPSRSAQPIPADGASG